MQLTIGSRRLHCTWKRCFSIYVNDFIDCLIYWRLVTNCFVGRLQIARDGSGGGGAGLGPSLLLSLITFHCNRHHSVVWLSRESKKRGVLASSCSQAPAVPSDKKRLGGVSHTIKIRVLSIERTLVFFASQAQLWTRPSGHPSERIRRLSSCSLHA